MLLYFQKQADEDIKKGRDEVMGLLARATRLDSELKRLTLQNEIVLESLKKKEEEKVVNAV